MATDTPTPNYVEVVGEASYQEPIESFNAEVTLAVRATSDEGALAQLTEFRRRCVAGLTGAGLRNEELQDGGLRLDRPWWWRRKDKEVGKNANHRILIKCAELDRLTTALNAIESSPANSRETVDVNMRQPTFRDDQSVRDEALRRAVANARQRAAALSEAGGVKLGGVLRIEEGVAAQRSSGFAGDEDWWGDRMRFAAGGAAGGVVMAAVAEQPEPLATPSRTIWVRTRVRFALVV